MQELPSSAFLFVFCIQGVYIWRVSRKGWRLGPLYTRHLKYLRWDLPPICRTLEAPRRSLSTSHPSRWLQQQTPRSFQRVHSEIEPLCCAELGLKN
uniref:Uncharacterized protein n=1 Tax=Ixodes ricinus TaxID=34613 RepID=A0A6B0UD79_IXORI